MRTRTAVAVAAVLLAGGGLAAAPAAAVTPAPSDTPPISHAVRATAAETQVGAFFEEYRLAVLGEIDEQPQSVRRRYLSPSLNLRLDDWASRNDADPVFRTRNIPTSWSVREVATAPDRATVALTQRWGDGPEREIRYTVRIADRRITDLVARPSP